LREIGEEAEFILRIHFRTSLDHSKLGVQQRACRNEEERTEKYFSGWMDEGGEQMKKKERE